MPASFAHTSKDQRKVLFVLHQMGTLDHVAALHRQLHRAGAAVHVAFGEEGLELPEWFTRETPDVTIIRDPLDAIAERRYDAVVMQMPYDELKDPVWSTIGRDEAFVVYAGYCVWIVTWDHGGYELPFHARNSLILASSPWAREKYLASEFAPADAVWSGDPLMYELAHADSLTESSPTIMWAPHWSETWVDGGPGFSTWKSTVHHVLSAARRHKDVSYIVRGHPLIKTEGEDRESRRATQSYNKLISLPNVDVSTSSMQTDILRSTALLTDGVSLIPYYSTTGKPLGVSRRKGTWDYFDSSGKALVNQSDALSTPQQIRHWLDMAAVLDTRMDTDRQELVKHLFPLHEKSPGEIMLERLPIV